MVSKFKAGDRVKVKRACCGTVDGKIYTLMKGFSDGSHQDTLVARGENLKENRGGCSCDYNWVKVGRGRPRKEKPVKFIVFYDETDGDPAKKFATTKELMEWIIEAQEDEDIIFDSIEVYLVGKRMEVELKTRVSLVKVK